MSAAADPPTARANFADSRTPAWPRLSGDRSRAWGIDARGPTPDAAGPASQALTDPPATPIDFSAALIDFPATLIDFPAAPIDSSATPIDSSATPIDPPAALIDPPAALIDPPAAPIDFSTTPIDFPTTPITAPGAPITAATRSHAPAAPDARKGEGALEVCLGGTCERMDAFARGPDGSVLRPVPPRHTSSDPSPLDAAEQPRQVNKQPRQANEQPRQVSEQPRQVNGQPRQVSEQPRQVNEQPRRLNQLSPSAVRSCPSGSGSGMVDHPPRVVVLTGSPPAPLEADAADPTAPPNTKSPRKQPERRDRGRKQP